MKTTLLHKCRKDIMILNSYGFPAQRHDKKVQVVRFGMLNFKPILTSKNKTIYENYGNAFNRRRVAILDMAREIHKKPWYWHILH